MRFLCYAVLIAAMVPLSASANEIDGKWKAWFVGPMAHSTKLAEIVFNFKVEGDRLTGMAYMAECPGDASISDGKIDGNRVSFTVIGKNPWESGGAGWESSGYDRLKFTGTIRGNEIKLVLIWDSVLIHGTRKPDTLEMEMDGRKMAEGNGQRPNSK